MVKPYIPNRGDILIVDFSPHMGREQTKRRPALVLSPSEYNGLVGLAIVAPITSKIKSFRFEVPLPASLRTQGVVLADQLKSFDWRARKAVFEEVAPESVIDEVTARVSALLDLR